MNAQLAPIEDALTRAGIAYVVRGVPFYQRQEVRGAVESLRRRPALDAQGSALAAAIRGRWAEAVGYEEDGGGDDGQEARERQASLETLVAIVDGLVAADPAADLAAVLADLEARAAHERDGAADGVNLLTYHRAKGLEWDAVALPALEEGSLPIRQALDDEAALAEERRLLYVGMTRARVHLAPVLGRVAGGARAREPPPAEPVPAGRPPAPRDAAAGAAARGRAAPADRLRPMTRCSPRCASGAPTGPGVTPCRRTSSRTTRPWRRSPSRGRGRSRPCGA